MSDEHPPTSMDDLGEIDRDRTAHLLGLGLDGPKKPIDSLLERLRDDGTGELFTALLRSGSGRDPAELEVSLVRGQGTQEDYLGLKQQSVALFREYRDLNAHLSATAIYFTTIAAALVHRKTKITSQSEQDLEAAYLDLAAAVPKPWDDLFVAAIEHLQRIDG